MIIAQAFAQVIAAVALMSVGTALGDTCKDWCVVVTGGNSTLLLMPLSWQLAIQRTH